ncbi:MAG: GntR family transcriptional regulator [Rhizobiales bacterium 62-17]|nr:GntR family transcriptional regulator [Hyphomicrobiales bacterium]OJX99844.1 MAG: GntR family transcriptional regulator [Rhizobiales bacterium 62-17]
MPPPKKAAVEPLSLNVGGLSRSLRELALEKMRDAIIESHFKPGARLVERDLCTQLGVSRTIVREVLRHLESEGLVSTTGTRGPIVALTTPEQAMQIYEIRGALEGMAAKACAQGNKAEIADALDAALERIRSAYRKRDMNRVLSETSEFYRTLFESAGRDVAWGVVSALTARINRLRSMTIRTPGRDANGPAQMQRIVDAIRKGNGDAAARAAQEHVAQASAIARDVLADSATA